MGGAEWALLLTLGVLWGGFFFFQKIALAALPPLAILNNVVPFSLIGLAVIDGRLVTVARRRAAGAVPR